MKVILPETIESLGYSFISLLIVNPHSNLRCRLLSSSQGHPSSLISVQSESAYQ